MSNTGNDAPAPRNSTGSMDNQFLGTIREELQGSSHVSIVDETSEHVEETTPKPTKAKRKLRKTQSSGAPSQYSWRRGSNKPPGAPKSPVRSKSGESLPKHDRSPNRSKSSGSDDDHMETSTRSTRSYFSRATSTQATHLAGSTDEMLDLDEEDDFLDVKARSSVSTISVSGSRRISGASNRRSFWKDKNRKEMVDQSVNLMDAETGQYEQKTSRRGMGTGFRQKSLVDIFLSDDYANSENNRRSRGGLGDSLSSLDKENGGGVGKWLMLVFLVCLGVSAVLTIPSLGIVNSGGNNTPAPPTKPSTNPPTDAPKTNPPTDAPAPAPTDAPKTNPPTDAPAPAPAPDDQDLNVALTEAIKGGESLEKASTPKATKSKSGRQEAIQSLVTDQDISDPSDFEDANSPVSKALQWIASEDKAQLPIPGLDKVPDDVIAKQELVQRYAMAVFYFSQEAESTSGNEEGALRRRLEEATPEERANRQQFGALWTSERPVCLWTGVTCNAKKMVTDLYLSESLLKGTIPRELLSGAAFPFLTILDLSYNQLGGTLPRLHDAVGADVSPSESALEFLYLQHNSIQGNIDPIMALERLTYVDLSNNKFSGPIPAELGAKLQQLDALHLATNNLDGELPAGLADLPQLTHLDLDENMFTGGIPEEWAALTELQVLTLSHCETIDGPIPEAFADMRKLTHLSLTGTKVQGTIPAFLGDLTLLHKLYLHRTEMEGAMPQQICDLRASSLHTLTSDCNEDLGTISCDCCTDCFGR